MTHVCEVKDGAVERYAMLPEDMGLRRWEKADILGGDAERNSAILRDVLSGTKGAPRDAVLANAAAALVVAGAAQDLPAGVRIAATAVDSGAALDKLERMRALSQAAA
jgi:anthranilate phosphoribosyltransferase